MSFECWIFSHFIWSLRIAASLGNCSLHPIVTAVCVIPSHLLSQLFHRISPHPISCLLSHSQFFSADHNCSHRFSCHLSFSRLFSSHLTSAFQIFTALLDSSQLSAAHLSSCKLILGVLISSLLFSHLLSSSHISTDLSSCQLVSPHLSSSQRTLKSSHLFSGPKPALKTDLGAKASNPYAFHREDLTQRSSYTQQAFAQRSL